MGYYIDLALRKADGLIEQSGQPLSKSDALSEVFKERPDLYEEYRKESRARPPREEPVSGSTQLRVEKTLAQMTAEGVAKRLGLPEGEEGLRQVFRLRPELYEQHRRESYPRRSVSAA